MTISDGVLLGIIQGLTEFLPVSSSGHLILARELFGISASYGLAVDAVLHFATALAVLVYFHRDVWDLMRTAVRAVRGQPTHERERTLLIALAVATVPAVAAGLALESLMATVFRNGWLVVGALTAGSLVLGGAEYAANRFPQRELTVSRGFFIGCMQTLALIPGMSRSGMAIAGGMFAGLTRAYAARFAFLLALPLLLGSGAKKILELLAADAAAGLGISVVVAALAAFGVGIAAIHYLLAYLRSRTLYVFIGYRLMLAAGVAIWLLVVPAS
jgi:undecaprenyl-diphosphatase